MFESVCNALYELTGEKLYAYTGQDVSELFSYMLNYGIHSKGENSDGLAGRKSNHKSKFSVLLSTLFLPDKNERKTIYPKLSKHIIFYPILVVHRFFVLVLHRRKKFKALMKLNRTDFESQKEFLNKYGIVKMY